MLAYYKPSLALIIVFTVVILLIHAQPYDDSEIRAFLTPPENCPAPCFMGIRPGLTTAEEAATILRNNLWVDDVEAYRNGSTNEINSISWSWSTTHPHYLREIPYTLLHGGSLTIEDNRVLFISIPTNFSVGDIWLGWGKPDFYSLTTIQGLDNSPVFLPFHNLYTQRQIVIASVVDCRYASKFLASQVVMEIGNIALPPVENEYSSSFEFERGMIEYQRGSC